MIARDLRLRDNRVLVKPRKPTQQLSSGLFAPETAAGPGYYRYGEIVAVGPGNRKTNGERDPVEVKVGDVCLFGRYVSGDEILIGQTCPWCIGAKQVRQAGPYEASSNVLVDCERCAGTGEADAEWFTIMREDDVVAIEEPSGTLRPLFDRLLVQHVPEVGKSMLCPSCAVDGTTAPFGYVQTPNGQGLATCLTCAGRGTVPMSKIVIPETVEQPHQFGVVIAQGLGLVGPDGARWPMTVKDGDLVMFEMLTGQGVTIDGRGYLVMREHEVLGVVEA